MQIISTKKKTNDSQKKLKKFNNIQAARIFFGEYEFWHLIFKKIQFTYAVGNVMNVVSFGG